MATAWDPMLVLDALRDSWAGYYRDPQRVECVLNCFGFPAPETVDTKIHTGLHPSLFQWYTSMSGMLMNLLEFVYETLRRHRAGGGGTCVLYCVDKHGRYASLAFAKALAEIVMADKSLTLGRVSTTACLRTIECGPCDRCVFWGKRFHMRNDAVSAVLRKWDGVCHREAGNEIVPRQSSCFAVEAWPAARPTV